MSPKKDKKKKKPLSKRLAATNLSKKEIEAFINRHKAINQRQYGVGGGSRVSRVSKADMKYHYGDMRNYYSPAMKAPKTLNIPVGTSPKDFFLSEEAQRQKTIFSKLKEESAFKQKLRDIELEELRLVMDPTIMKFKEKIYEDTHEQNIRHAKYNHKVEKMKHEKVLLDLAAKDEAVRNKYHTEKIKNANDISNHLKRYGAPREVYKNGVKQYVFDDPESLANKQQDEKLKKIVIEAREQDQQFKLDKLKHMNKHNNQSRKIGGTIINAKGKKVGVIDPKNSSLNNQKIVDTMEEKVKQLDHDYIEDKKSRERYYRAAVAEEKWKPKIDARGNQLRDPITGKLLWEGTGNEEADVEQKEHKARIAEFDNHQLKLKNELELRLKSANAKISDVVDVDGNKYNNLTEFIKQVYTKEHKSKIKSQEVKDLKKRNELQEKLDELDNRVGWDYELEVPDEQTGQPVIKKYHHYGIDETEKDLEDLRYRADNAKKYNDRQLQIKKQQAAAEDLKFDIEQRYMYDKNGRKVYIPKDKGAITEAYNIAVDELKRDRKKKTFAREIEREKEEHKKEDLDYDLTKRYKLNPDGTKTPIADDEGALKAKFLIDSKQVEHDKATTDLSNELQRLKQDGVLDKFVYDLVQRWSIDENGNRRVIEGNRGALLDKLTQYKAEQKASNIISEIDRMVDTDLYQEVKHALEVVQGLTRSDYVLKHTNPALIAPNGVVSDAVARQEEYVRQINAREETPPPKQERKQNAVDKLNHNLQETTFSILPPEQQEQHQRGIRSADDEYTAEVARNNEEIERRRYEMLHPGTHVSINQPIDNGVNEQVAAAELQQAQAEDNMDDWYDQSKYQNDPNVGEWWNIDGDAERNSGFYGGEKHPSGKTWDDFYEEQKKYAVQRMHEYLNTDEKDMGDWDDQFKRFVLNVKPYLTGKAKTSEEYEKNAIEQVAAHLDNPDTFDKPYTGNLTPLLAQELLLAKIRNPKRNAFSLIMDKRDKEIYYHEFPELVRSEKNMQLPNTTPDINKAIGKKIYSIKSAYASEQNINAQLKKFFNTNLDEVYDVYENPMYDIYD